MAGRVDPYRPRFRELRIDPLVERGAPALALLRWAGWLGAFVLFNVFWVVPAFMAMVAGVIVVNCLVLWGFALYFLPVSLIWILVRPFSRRRAEDWAFRARMRESFEWAAGFCFDRILDRYLFPLADRLTMAPLSWLHEKRLQSMERR